MKPRDPFLLRPLQPNEGPALRALLLDPELAPALFGLPATEQRLDHAVAMMLTLPQEHGCVRVLSAPGAACASSAVFGFAAVVDGFLAYGVRADMRRQGHATRLISSCSTAWHGVRLRASVLPNNAASARLLEGLCFRFMGRRSGFLHYELGGQRQR